MKKNCKQKLTIRNIINSLNDIMTRSSNIDLDSEVIIADLNFQEFDNIRIYPIKDVFYGQDKVGIFITPKKPQEITLEEQTKVIKKDLLDIEETVQEAQEELVQEAQEELVQVQASNRSNNWWEKYK